MFKKIFHKTSLVILTILCIVLAESVYSKFIQYDKTDYKSSVASPVIKRQKSRFIYKNSSKSLETPESLKLNTGQAKKRFGNAKKYSDISSQSIRTSRKQIRLRSKKAEISESIRSKFSTSYPRKLRHSVTKKSNLAKTSIVFPVKYDLSLKRSKISPPRLRPQSILNKKMAQKPNAEMNDISYPDSQKTESSTVKESEFTKESSTFAQSNDRNFYHVSLVNTHLEAYLNQNQLDQLRSLKFRITPTSAQDNNCFLYSLLADDELLIKILEDSVLSRSLLSKNENQRDLTPVRKKIFEKIFANLDKEFISPYGDKNCVRDIIQDFKTLRSYAYRYDFIEKVIDIINLTGQSNVIHNCTKDQGVQNLRVIFSQSDFINKVNAGKNLTFQNTALALNQKNFAEKIYWLLMVHQLEGQNPIHDLKNLILNLGRSGMIEVNSNQMQDITNYVQIIKDNLHLIKDEKTRHIFTRSLALREAAALILREDQEFLIQSATDRSTLDKDYADIIAFLYEIPIYVWGPSYNNPNNLCILNGYFVKMPYTAKAIHIHHEEFGGNHFSKLIQVKN